MSTNKPVYKHRVELGQRIAQLRASRGLTQRDLGNLIGMTVSGISRIEAGITNVQYDTLILIAQQLRVTPDVLVGSSEPLAMLQLHLKEVSSLLGQLRGGKRGKEADAADITNVDNGAAFPCTPEVALAV